MKWFREIVDAYRREKVVREFYSEAAIARRIRIRDAYLYRGEKLPEGWDHPDFPGRTGRGVDAYKTSV